MVKAFNYFSKYNILQKNILGKMYLLHCKIKYEALSYFQFKKVKLF